MTGGVGCLAIYTKTGDKGTTSLFDGGRVKKHELRVETYGTFDELNAHISLCAKHVESIANRNLLEKIQETMFLLCAELATEDKDKQASLTRITDLDIKLLEETIDKHIKELPDIHEFILLGESTIAAQLHIARAVTRRAERLLVALSEETTVRSEILQYVNRLSDLLFTMARDEDLRNLVTNLAEKIITDYNKGDQEVEIKQNADYFTN